MHGCVCVACVVCVVQHTRVGGPQGMVCVCVHGCVCMGVCGVCVCGVCVCGVCVCVCVGVCGGVRVACRWRQRRGWHGDGLGCITRDTDVLPFSLVVVFALSMIYLIPDQFLLLLPPFRVQHTEGRSVCAQPALCRRGGRVRGRAPGVLRRAPAHRQRADPPGQQLGQQSQADRGERRARPPRLPPGMPMVL